MLKVVFDTVIFVRALINPHGMCGSLILSHSLDYQLFVSPPVLKELLEVLRRKELIDKFKNLKNLNIESILQIVGRADVVEVSDIPSVSRDTKDNKFLATAEKAGADYLISEDLDLLTLKQYKGFKLINTRTFFQTLKSN